MMVYNYFICCYVYVKLIKDIVRMISRYLCILCYIVFYYIIMYFSINKIKYVLFVYYKYRYSIYWFYFFINKKYVF